eukprot:402314_1
MWLLNQRNILYGGTGFMIGFILFQFRKKPNASKDYSYVDKLGGSKNTLNYIMKHGNRFMPELQEIYELTETKFGSDSAMITATDQVYFFKWLVSTLNCRKCIEIGTFTGASGLGIAKGMSDGLLISFDVNKEYTDIARTIWKKAKVDKKIKLSLDGGINGLDNLLKIKHEKGTYDFAYVDAIKTEYGEYYERLLLLMKKGGIIAFDNVLWEGKVANVKYNDEKDKITKYFREFNLMIKNDDRVEMCMLTIGDGLTMVTVK